MERKSLTLIVPLVLFAMLSLASADPSFGSIQTRRVPNSAQLIRRDGSCTGTYCDFGGLCVGGTCDCSTSIGYDGIGCDTPSSCINNPCENNGACQTFASPTLSPYQDSSLDYTRSSLNTYSVGCNTGDQDLLYSYEQLLVRFYSTICTNGKAPSVSGVGFYVKSAVINTTDLQAVADLLITVSITAATGPADYATGAVLASVEIPYSDLVATFDSVAGENGFFHVAKFDTLVDIPCSTAIAVSLHNSDMSSIKGFFQVGALQEQLHPDIQPAYGLAASCAVNSLTSLDNIFGSNYPTPALSVVFDPLSLVQCVCPAGTTGALCDVDLSDNCLPNPCENGGTCTNENFDYSCTCPVGFGGKSCELTQGIDSCFSFPCTNGGSCSNVRDTSGQKFLALESFSNAVVTSVQNTRFIGWNFNIDQLVSVIEVGFTLPGAFAPKVVIIFDPTLKIWAYGDITSVASLDNGFFYTASVYGPGLLQPGQYYLQLDLGVAGDGEVYTTTAAMNWNKDITIVNSVQCETGPFCTTVSNLDFIAPQFRFIFGNVFTFHCDCPAGFTGPTCETDINECSSSPCVNSGTCSEGFMSDYFECICPIGFTGLVCETNINDCASSPCSNGATCLDVISSYVCFCAQGYSGSRCESEFDACDSSPCSNGGICSQGALPNTVVCFCPPGFTGDNCGTALSNNGCESSPCSNGGVCITGTFSYSCSCLTGYTGVNCETNLNATPCDSNPCLGGGTCVASPTAFICLCNSLHTGSRCQSVILASSKTVFTIEPPISFPDPIYNGVTYINGPFGNNVGAEFNGNGRLNSSASYNPTQPLNGFSIGSWYRADTGSSGWVLFKGTSTGFRNFGVYLYQLNQWWFSYTNGTEVKQLAFRGALTDGNWHYVQCIVSTTDVRMYVDGQPLATIGGTTNTTFAFGPTGYPNEGPSTRGLNTGARLGTSVFSLTGDLSGTFLSSDKSLGQCEFAGAQNTFSQVCFNGGVCVNNAATGGFNCHCPPTWTGNLCEIPQICGSSPCFNGATCVASNLTSFTCSCVPGFYGDLCQTAATSCFPGLCLNGGTCNNIPGLFVCTCPTGFTGIICQTNIDDCASNPCLNGGVCVDGINSYTCSCSQLYIGARCETLALNSTLLIFTLEPYVSQIDPIYNGVTYTTGAYGSTNAVTSQGNGRLNGTASYNPPVPMNGFSIGSWLKLAPNQGGWILVKLNDGFRNFGVFVQAQKQIWFSYNEITGNKTQKNLAFVTTGAPFQDNNWHYVQCNVKLTSVSCFMDGANMVTNLGATSYPLPNYLTEGPVTRPLYTLARTSTGPNVFSLNGSLTGTFLSSMQSLPMCVYAGAKTNNVVCQNGGVCRDNLVTGGFACVCPLGLTGQLCETQLPLDVCVSNPCLNNGTCNTGVYTFTCTCPSGFTGTFCQTNINDCVVGLCLNGGVCVDGINSYRCACTVGFTGPSCQTRYLHCLPTSCSNGGTCIPGNSTTSFDFACVCASGFTGPTCASQTNECESSPCVHGTCSNRLGRYTCTCDSFYTGVNCESSLPKLNDTVFTLASNVSTVDPTYPGVAATTGPFSESGAFIFNGTGDLISNPALSPSLPMNGFSIGSWIKTAFVPEGGNQPSGWILFKGQNGFRNFGLFLSPLRQLWFSYTNVTVIQVAFPCGNLTDGNWHYVQAVVTLTSVTMYVDGMQLRTLSGQYAYSFNYLTEGPANRPLNTGSRTGDNRFGLSGTLFGTFLSSLKDVGQCEYASAMTVNGQVCFNNGVCEDNNSTVGGFVCKCAPGFAGALCQISGVDVVNFIASGNADGSNAVVLASNVLSLTGSTSWFVLPVSNLPQPQPVMVPLTFSAWVLAASPGRPAWIFFKGISGSADGRFFGVFYTGTAVQWFAGNTPVITSSPVDLSLSSWTNIAVTVRSNTTRLFINGVLAGISTVPIPWGPTLELVLGTRMNNAGTGKSTDFAFVGSMQDTRIYTAINRPLCVAAASIRLCANGGTCTATVGGGYQCA